jgi:hypothetical protein
VKLITHFHADIMNSGATTPLPVTSSWHSAYELSTETIIPYLCLQLRLELLYLDFTFVDLSQVPYTECNISLSFSEPCLISNAT